MRRIGSALLLLLLGLTGCSLTREPKPPRPPEELRAPPDQVNYQTPNFYPNSMLNQDTNVRSREAANNTPTMLGNMRRGMTGSGAGGGMGMGGMGGPGGP